MKTIQKFILGVSCAALLPFTIVQTANAADNSVLPILQNPELVHSWSRATWNFPNPDQGRNFSEEKIYVKAPIHGVEADHQGNIYVSTPRLLESKVPATFSKVVEIDGKSVLEPWPNWQTHSLSNNDGLNNILGGYVDSKNQIWLLDMGFVEGDEISPENSQKLVAFNAETGEEVFRFIINPKLANPRTSFLNDLVIDEDRGFVFISDSGNRGGSPVPAGIIVIDLNTNKARRVLDKHISVQDDPERPLIVNGEEVFPNQPLAIGINGITLSPDGETLYWSITTGDALYAIDTSLIRNFSTEQNVISERVKGPFRFGGGSDAIIGLDNGHLLVTDITNNRLVNFNPETERFHTVIEGKDFIWPDSLAFDFKGNVLLTTNHLNHAFGGTMDFDKSDPNFRIFRLPISNLTNP